MSKKYKNPRDRTRIKLGCSDGHLTKFMRKENAEKLIGRVCDTCQNNGCRKILTMKVIRN